ncbi:hypothetical protein [Mucilaginibacter jinjuensis]|uniref:DUF4280 domain-containing protein n=1 Tax=Mucilaginibacter jinjuensis TaxID=1176721 RepID=A0ABY7T2G4_9SPHI|nr:hypothetical protein [Mucilaginibacter jinjuensis]WCT10458.1 hypothetical protein PQO05_17110 [Mucilaginibacter jinjuensis]
MSASYIPKNVNAICTFSKDSSPRMFIDTRPQISVFYNKNQERTLLTIADRNVNAEFPCKSPKNAMWSFLAFGAGLIVGALLLSNPVGWVIAAGIGLMAVGAYYATQVNHKCTGALGKGNWKVEHLSVRFNQERAITHNSMLVCDAGGVLSPIFSSVVANKYAQKIEANNASETTLNTIASFFGGAGAVLAIAEGAAAAGTWGVTKIFMWMGGTMAVVSAGTYEEKELIRSNSLKDNQHYQDLNKADPNDIMPGYTKDPATMTPGDLGSPDILEVDGKTGWFAKDAEGKTIVVFNGKQYIQDIKGNYTELKQGTQLAGDLKKIEGVDPREMYKNEDAKAIVKNIREGKYSENLIKSSKDGNQVVRPRDLNKVLPDINTVKIQNMKSLGKLGVKGGGLVAFLFPFIATGYSEAARMDLANAMAEDMGNGISIYADLA